MIKKNEESGKINSFKRFSELNKSAKPTDEEPLSVLPDTDANLPANPNLPVKSKKVEKTMDTRYMKPNADKTNYDKDEYDQSEEDTEKVEEGKDVKFYGKVAQFPKKTKASKAYKFLEGIHTPKSSIWYIMVEKCENELQMVKYNNKKGVELTKFVNELKTYYSQKYATNDKVLEMIGKISVDGNNTFSMIKNIPLIEVDGKKMISKITEDLIKLLSK